MADALDRKAARERLILVAQFGASLELSAGGEISLSRNLHSLCSDANAALNELDAMSAELDIQRERIAALELERDRAFEQGRDAVAVMADRIAALEAERDRLSRIIDTIGELSTGWKCGNEGVHLLRIQSLASGNGTPQESAALADLRD